MNDELSSRMTDLFNGFYTNTVTVVHPKGVSLHKPCILEVSEFMYVQFR